LVTVASNVSLVSATVLMLSLIPWLAPTCPYPYNRQRRTLFSADDYSDDEHLGASGRPRSPGAE